MIYIPINYDKTKSGKGIRNIPKKYMEISYFCSSPVSWIGGGE